MKYDLWLWVPVMVLLACQSDSRNAISFNNEIRPIFNAKCLRCHGGVKANGDFSLLFEADAFSPTQSGKPAIIPGHHNRSELYRRLVTDDAELRMPHENDALSPSEIDLIAQWIDQGAKWEKHWAYKLPSNKIQPPSFEREETFIRNDLDRFILDKLLDQGLAPNPDANRESILRRLCLDLTGLPPTLNQIKNYAEGENMKTVENIVDELLDSPHFGERWASMWLDLARYADTKGYEKDQSREIWKFRDYVINSFNEDKPFDQFTIEQLAGDLLPNASDEQLIATAFHRNSISNDEGGTDDEEFRIASVIERVSTTYEVWQSTTMACVQCHSHPYDPFRQEDFYRSMAYFNNAEDRDNYNENPKLFTYTPEQKIAAQNTIDWIYKHVPDHLLPDRSGTTIQQKNAILGKLHFRSTEAEDYTYSSPFIEIIWPDLDMLWQIQDSSWIKFEGINFTHVNQIGFLAATELDYAGSISIHLDSLNGPEIGRIKINKTGTWDGWQGNKPPDSKLLREFIATIKPTEGSHDVYYRFWVGDTYIQHLFYLDKITYYESNAPYLQLDKRELNKLIELLNIPSTSTPIIRELSEEKSRKTFIFDRGSWLSPAKEVTAKLPAIFADSNHVVDDRLAFARWLVDEKNPLTARVIVNRIWEQIFGRGLVETMEEFGTQGDPPSHPELLDWLAHRLINEFQWHLKPLIREIVLSGTYRQSSDIDSIKNEIDPDNRWLSRGVRVRLSSEQIRDQILAASGLLNSEIGGPSVIIPELKIRSNLIPSWAVTESDEFYRRSLYLFWKRTDPFSNLITFDSPDRTTCTSRRVRTNTPLQALNLLNDETYLKASFALAKKMHQIDIVENQIKHGYQLATGSEPDPKKLQALLDLYASANNSYEKLKIPEFIKNENLGKKDKIELAALTLVSSTIFNLDEFVVKK